MFMSLLDTVRNPLWRDDLDKQPPFKRTILLTMRIVDNLLQDLIEGQLSLRATSLVYTTILSLVPLLALSFSVLKSFGVHNRVQTILNTLLQPLGAEAQVLSENILGFVDRLQVGVLGSLGLILLVYTVVSLIQKIEDSLNYIFKAGHGRELIRQFSDYLTIIFVGPMLYVTVGGITAALLSQQTVQDVLSLQPVGLGFYVLTRITPFFLIALTFTLTYLFIPNTQVNFKTAFIGGLCAALLWQFGGLLFTAFVVSSTQYNAVYLGFAIVILLLIWLYVLWLIMLIGAQIAFYLQHPHFISRDKHRYDIGDDQREMLALAFMYLVARAYIRHEAPPTVDQVVQILGIPGFRLLPVLDSLLEHRLVLQVSSSPAGHVPGMDLGNIHLHEIIMAARQPALPNPDLDAIELPAAVAQIQGRLTQAIQMSFGERNLRDLVLENLAKDDQGLPIMIAHSGPITNN